MFLQHKFVYFRWTYDVSCVMQDGRILKMLFRKVYIEMVDLLYVFGCGELAHLILQISIHNLCIDTHKVFLPYVFSDEL